jgi:hypothetical protein
MSFHNPSAQLAVLYEHPQWFQPLFTALARRGVPYVPIQLSDHRFDPANREVPAPLVLSRVAQSSFLREPEHPIFYAEALLDHWQRCGATVLNGRKTLEIDSSKARQLSLISSLGLAIPETRVVHRVADLVPAAESMAFPLLVKANIGGSGAGITRFSFAGERYKLDNAICEPKPARKPRPTIYAGGESEAAKTMITTLCDGYVMHGDPVDAIKPKIADMEERRARVGKSRMHYGRPAFAIVRDSEAEAKREFARVTQMPPKPPKGFDNFEQWLSGTELERELKLQEYSVSNRGLRPNFVGTPEQLRERIEEYDAAGLDLLLLQMSPQAEEMDRFAAQVIEPMRAKTPELA